MPHLAYLHRTVALIPNALLLGTSCSPAQGTAPSLQTLAPPAMTSQGGVSAAGASEDSVQACLDRIPNDARTGQRSIAEQSCQRDEGARTLLQAVLGQEQVRLLCDRETIDSPSMRRLHEEVTRRGLSGYSESEIKDVLLAGNSLRLYVTPYASQTS